MVFELCSTKIFVRALLGFLWVESEGPEKEGFTAPPILVLQLRPFNSVVNCLCLCIVIYMSKGKLLFNEGKIIITFDLIMSVGSVADQTELVSRGTALYFETGFLLCKSSATIDGIPRWKIMPSI